MGLFRKLRTTFQPPHLDSALNDELRFHFEKRTDDFIAPGPQTTAPCTSSHSAGSLSERKTIDRECPQRQDHLV
jgi:hypothetical protein